jgi:hypothetical protein
MSIFGKDFLERVKSRRAPAKTPECVGQSENVRNQNAVRQARAAEHSRALVDGPCVRSSVKSSWRDDARILEELYPERISFLANQAKYSYSILISPDLL